jgi:hypothetical protein
MILIFASIRRPLYKRDVLNVCCEAHDSQIQFAYQLKWIAEPLRANPKHLKKKKALIVYCAQTDQPKTYRFYPVRSAVIADVKEEFGYITLSLELHEFVDYAAYGDDVDNAIARFQAFVTEGKTDHPNNQAKSAMNEPEARFVRSEAGWGEGKFCEGWAHLVSYISTVPGLNDAVFFCVQDRNNTDGKPIPIFPNPANAESPTSYVLTSGGSYTVSAFLMSGTNAEYEDPELVVKESVAAVSGPFVRQRSSGFQADFVIQCKRSLDEENSMLTLRVPAHPNKYISPVANVLVKLSPRRGTLYVAVSMLTLGAFLISLTPETVGQLHIEHKDLMSALFKLVGLVVFATGSYFGFRKLPTSSG